MVDLVEELAKWASLTLLRVVNTRLTVAAALIAHIGSGGHIGDPARRAFTYAFEVVEVLGDRLAR